MYVINCCLFITSDYQIATVKGLGDIIVGCVCSMAMLSAKTMVPAPSMTSGVFSL